MKKLSLAFLISLFSLPVFANDCERITLPEGISFSELERCTVSSGRVVVVNKLGRYGFVDTEGKLVIPATLDEAWSFQEGLAVVKKDGKWGHIRPDGTFAVPPIYHDAWGFSDGLAKVERAKKFGFVNQLGVVVVPIKYDETYHWFDEERTAVSQNGKWGIIDTKGRLLTKLEFESLTSPSEGLILASKLNSDNELVYGYLDRSGKVVIDFKYSYAQEFSGGTAIVRADDDPELINRYGETVTPKPSYLSF